MASYRPDRPWRTGNRSGFTLIELGVTMMVLGLLAAMALPPYLRASQRAMRGSCYANQRNLVQAAILYCAEAGTTGGEITSESLVDLGYATQAMSQCPSGDGLGFDDYRIVISAGEVSEIECSVRGEEHLLQL